MASPERVDERSAGRLSRAWSGTRQFVRLGYRDPEHVTERMALYAAEHLAEHSREWAEAKVEANPDTPRVKIADDLRTQSAQAARIDGAVAGTPFLVALVPGYVAYLWQEGRMGLRTAALYGRDPSDPRTTAEMLALRGVHPTPEQAAAALEEVRDAPPPPKPTTRRPLRVWVRSVKALLIFGGFLDPPTEERIEVAHPRLKAAAGIGIGVGIWLITWVLPLTFMIAMAWACESHTRRLGRRILLFYDGQADSTREAISAAERRTDKGHDRRQVLRVVALVLSIAIPIGFVVVANYYRQSTGISWLGALGALVALSLVVTITVVTARR
ncbi:MAG: hypothetical protein ACJ76K_03465 [Solirubrobacteraceae bacterium]